MGLVNATQGGSDLIGHPAAQCCSLFETRQQCGRCSAARNPSSQPPEFLDTPRTGLVLLVNGEETFSLPLPPSLVLKATQWALVEWRDVENVTAPHAAAS